MEPDIRLIAAVGRQGQLGLGGQLPWKDPADLRWFREQTQGGVVLMGRRTHVAVGELPGRFRASWGGKTDPSVVIKTIVARWDKRTIWVAGGAHTYKSFLPFVRIAVLTLNDYEGEADVYMPPLWDANNNRPATAASDSGTSPTSETFSDHPYQEATAQLGRKRHRWKRRTKYSGSADKSDDG
jgi:dihydrofolate reductase